MHHPSRDATGGAFSFFLLPPFLRDTSSEVCDTSSENSCFHAGGVHDPPCFYMVFRTLSP